MTMAWQRLYDSVNLRKFPITDTKVILMKPILSHALEKDFPEHAALIQTLKENDAHFLHLLREHDEVDRKITKQEAEDMLEISDEAFHEMKLKRMKLKDALSEIISKAL
jgi:uncharacterized protein YdcH (DUF465 family)